MTKRKQKQLASMQTIIELADNNTYDISNAKHVLHDDKYGYDIYELENGIYVFEDGTPLVYMDECYYGLNKMTLPEIAEACRQQK